MKPEFTYHELARHESPARTSRLADAVTEYFAYVALVCVAVAVAVVTMAFSANVAVRVLDQVTKPGYFDAQSETNSPAKTQGEGDSAKPVHGKFAMLPATLPLRIKDDVISSNF